MKYLIVIIVSLFVACSMAGFWSMADMAVRRADYKERQIIKQYERIIDEKLEQR